MKLRKIFLLLFVLGLTLALTTACKKKNKEKENEQKEEPIVVVTEDEGYAAVAADVVNIKSEIGKSIKGIKAEGTLTGEFTDTSYELFDEKQVVEGAISAALSLSDFADLTKLAAAVKGSVKLNGQEFVGIELYIKELLMAMQANMMDLENGKLETTFEYDQADPDDIEEMPDVSAMLEAVTNEQIQTYIDAFKEGLPEIKMEKQGSKVILTVDIDDTNLLKWIAAIGTIVTGEEVKPSDMGEMAALVSIKAAQIRLEIDGTKQINLSVAFEGKVYYFTGKLNLNLSISLTGAEAVNVPADRLEAIREGYENQENE